MTAQPVAASARGDVDVRAVVMLNAELCISGSALSS
jgi:hypothetical protein